MTPTSAENPKPKFQNKHLLFAQLGAVLLGTLVLLIGVVPDLDDNNSSVAATLVLLLSVGLIYTIVARQIQPKAKQINQNNNPYHGLFFRGTVVLTSLLTLFGILGSFFVYIEHRNLFQAVGLAAAVIWIAVFLVYFMWSVYFYNINYGITDDDWERIYEQAERKRAGLFITENEQIEAPKYNPYRSQTFGLPPGTVRGMIAFTLLMGGMSLLITSFGSGYTGVDLVLLRQQFEFFETAFLMMIAFYFGDRSLKYISRRWNDPNATDASGTSPSLANSQSRRPLQTAPLDDIDLEDREFEKDESEFTETPPSSLTDQRNMLSASLDAVLVEQEGNEFNKANDMTYAKILSDMDIRIALEEFAGSTGIKLSLPVVKAVIAVESSGRGHLADGRAKILFEGHVFWRNLERLGESPQNYVKGNEDILFQKWTRAHYKGGSREYDRLERAISIHPQAAVYAASWGMFQILGENLDGYIKGRKYKDTEDFVKHQHESEYFHLLDFLEFIRSKTSRGNKLIDYISEGRSGDYDWEAFAFGYNGSGYAVSQYHTRMKVAYEKLKAQGI
ncbi:Putative phage-encoded peptidoglycan binding protein [Lunatimonas lonarensis]|uniref:Putative phage-encoded peptidoglycan binding protein n=1 Tax=Lunatimonas lonarensis TaxID=1232681 RepID=R7ZSK5_9BACT|nr:N-acetylmuramidase family protein [Lunatimonas lonarensis]EON77111.1 Putative phage-encoded peptidoglycan binding protein [Lunatimonas lonarensis]